VTNRLAQETSPYLLQHAHNPVDWYPWGEEALELARAEDRPILLSVGYSACHWCHVMERESFEDEQIAALMNRDFVNIKVDREERPDIDAIYMSAVQAFSGGRGGWPMTVFLAPDGRPFLGGTYFPPVPRGGMPSFPQVLDHAAEVWRRQREGVQQVGQQVLAAMVARGALPARDSGGEGDWLQRVADDNTSDFDPVNAGFGHAPKFPPHGALAVLLARAWRSDGANYGVLALQTLDAMARGGMYDLAGGGFARYSVDAAWVIPHFEKMLYDNAQLVPLYIDAWRLAGQPQHRRIARESLDWMVREMQAPDGGLCSALDADSEGEEGLFYVWTPAQIVEVLGADDGERVCRLLQVSPHGSFEHGTSVLRLDPPLEKLPAEDADLLRRSLPALRQVRDKRIWPARDDKVLTAWNAMAISAFARSAAAFDNAEDLAFARKTARFLLDRHTVDGRLMRTSRAGRVQFAAFLDDHALLVAALIDLYQADFDPTWLDEALALSDRMVALFDDPSGGGMFFTGADVAPLVTRSKNPFGGAVPSANGAAALAFSRLAVLCDRPDLGQRADAILAAYEPMLDRAARAFGVEALAAAWRAGQGLEIAIAGDPNGSAAELLATARKTASPLSLIASLPEGPAGESAISRLPWLAGKGSVKGQAAAWVCVGHTCHAPQLDPAALADRLRPDGALAVAGEPAPDDDRIAPASG